MRDYKEADTRTALITLRMALSAMVNMSFASRIFDRTDETFGGDLEAYVTITAADIMIDGFRVDQRMCRYVAARTLRSGEVVRTCVVGVHGEPGFLWT